jgi:hypothetical protein
MRRLVKGFVAASGNIHESAHGVPIRFAAFLV